MKMKKTLSACSVAVGAQMFLPAIFADDLPKALSFARYEPILNHSPFAVATCGGGANDS